MTAPPPIQTTEAAAELRATSHVHTWIGDDCPEGWRHVGSIDVADPADIVTARSKGRRIGEIYDGYSGSVAEPCCADTYARTPLGEKVDELAWRVEDLKQEVSFERHRLLQSEANLRDLAKMYGEACGALAEYRSAAVEWQVEQAEFNASAAADRETVERVERVEAENARLQDRIDTRDEALQRIVQWADAYPTDIFTPPDYPAISKTLTANGFVPGHTLDGIAADCMRRATEGVGKIARNALSGPATGRATRSGGGES